MENQNNGQAGATAQKVKIGYDDAITGGMKNWFYGDMLDKQYKIQAASVGETKKKKKCFEIAVEGRKEPVRIMPLQAIACGIADVIDGDVVFAANIITAISEDGAIALAKVS